MLTANTNFAATMGRLQLAETNHKIESTLQKLSSGKSINSAKDNAAGLAIASRFTSQIRGYNQGIKNTNDAISMAQTAEGAMNEISANVQRIRELAVQSANASNSSVDRTAVQTEIAQLQAEIVRSTSTQFNGKKVIGADATSFAYQVGPNAGDTVKMNTKNVASIGGYAGVATTGTASTVAGASALITQADTFLASLNTQRASLGAYQNRFDSIIRNAENISANLEASRSRIEDADMAKETAKLTKYQILQQAGASILSQANQNPQMILSLLR